MMGACKKLEHNITSFKRNRGCSNFRAADLKIFVPSLDESLLLGTPNFFPEFGGVEYQLTKLVILTL